MLQGNASEDYFINFTLKHKIPKSFVGRLFRERTITLHLADDWYNDFCGFSICVVTKMRFLYVEIVIKQEVDKDSLFELCPESSEAGEPEYDGTTTRVGYISFGSLRHTALSISSYTTISVSLVSMHEGESYFGAQLVPRKSKHDQPQTTKLATDSPESCDKELHITPQPFRIIHDSRSSIKTTWRL